MPDRPFRPLTSHPAPLSTNKRWLKALELTAVSADTEGRILPDVIDHLATRYGTAPALLSDLECFDYATLAARSNRYSRWALAQGLGASDVVGLMMENRPDYLAAWIGITRVGATVALLNTRLTGRSLAHCVDLVTPGHVILGQSCRSGYETAVPFLATKARPWHHGEAEDLQLALEAVSGAPLNLEERRPVAPLSRALCIFTSGTTGLPKAANVSHHRIMTWSYWFAGLAGTVPSDRMYDCLPLYHSVGGVVAPGCVLVSGGSVVIRDGFSAREFWNDVGRWDCTLFQYIGELCRYLLNGTFGQDGPTHRLRLALGNGLRPDIWTAFKDRFAIPEIMEFYAATEGSFSLVNVEGKPGAIGRIPPFLAHRFPAALVQFDVTTGEPSRDREGFCLKPGVDEVGEAIGLLRKDTATSSGTFEGYTSAADSARKILRDVFEPGDRWFRTGDLMRIDRAGFWYFVDRIGDTFRWKGENVATSEVADVLTGMVGVVEASVYGVSVPGHDGRAGMAALVTDEDFDLAALRRHLVSNLPAYARPVFLRLRPDIETTDTFKQKKAPLAAQGFDPAVVADPLYVEDRTANAYIGLDGAVYGQILSGRFRL